MNQTAIFWPMLAHVVLIYGIYVLLSRQRVKAVSAGSAKSSQFRENLTEPPESLFVHNSLRNQFELPLLFYPLCISFFVTDGATMFTVILAWLFVALRFLHAYIHMTTNRIRYRRPIFALGWLVLGILWLTFAIHIAGLV